MECQTMCLAPSRAFLALSPKQCSQVGHGQRLPLVPSGGQAYGSIPTKRVGHPGESGREQMMEPNQRPARRLAQAILQVVCDRTGYDQRAIDFE
jgi:hypothetical protein